MTRDQVRGITDYARLAVGEDDVEELCAYLNDAIGLLEPLRSLELEDVEPTYYPIGDLTNVMSPDSFAPERVLSPQQALGGAVTVCDQCFKVPSILGGA